MRDSATTVTVGNGLVMVAPWIDRLGPLLTLNRRVRETPEEEEDANGNVYYKGGSGYILVTEKLYQLEKVNGAVVGYAPEGLLSRITGWLSRNGIYHSVKDNRDPLPMPDFSRVDFKDLESRKGQEQALEKVAVSRCGVVSAATGYGKTFLIAQICKMYPDLRIVIATARKTVVMSIYERLMEDDWLKCQTGVVCSSKDTGSDFRVTVSTAASLHRTSYEATDLLLVDECHNFAAQSYSEKIALFAGCRRFGFSASPSGRSDKADILGEAMFGPSIFDFSYEDAVDSGSVVPIEVHLYAVKKGDSSEYTNQASVNRHGIWRNTCRNHMIARIARQYPDDQVLIMCETLEHVMHIKRYLPEAKVAYATCSRERYESEYQAKGFTDDPYVDKAEVERLRKGLESGEVKLIISTMIFREGVNFRNLRVLIRADGMSCEIPSTQIPGRLSRTQEGKEKGILVDFNDLFDRRLRSRSRKRLAVYRKKGWVIKNEQTL